MTSKALTELREREEQKKLMGSKCMMFVLGPSVIILSSVMLVITQKEAEEDPKEDPKEDPMEDPKEDHFIRLIPWIVAIVIGVFTCAVGVNQYSPAKMCERGNRTCEGYYTQKYIFSDAREGTPVQVYKNPPRIGLENRMHHIYHEGLYTYLQTLTKEEDFKTFGSQVDKEIIVTKVETDAQYIGDSRYPLVTFKDNKNVEFTVHNQVNPDMCGDCQPNQRDEDDDGDLWGSNH
jgi:hypothetical protein